METKDLINQEIGHRMKNLLSVVGSLVTLSGEHHPEARQFIVAFQSRLSSLAATHALLVGSDWQPIPFRGLIGKVLEPLGVAHRVRLAGSINILVGSHDAHTLALALHELATNAIKYGALSNGTGYVKLTASVESHVGSEALLLTWEERDGPAVEAPKGKGFGLSLLRRLTRRQEQPETFLQWRVSGLVCSLSFGLTSKEESH